MDAKGRITEAAVRLTELRGIDKLTVKEIADEAGVSRRTFYDHYHSISDLMDCILENVTSDMIDRALNVPETADVLDLFIDAMEQSRDTLSRILNSGYCLDAERRLLAAFKRVIGKVLSQINGNIVLERGEEDFLTDITSCMVMGYLLEHFEKKDIDAAKIKSHIVGITRAIRKSSI